MPRVYSGLGGLLLAAGLTFACQQGGPAAALASRGARATVRGRLVWSGRPPAARTLQATTDLGACAQQLTQSTFQVRDHAVQGVLAWFDVPPEPGPQKVVPSAVVDQRGCLFLPPLLGATAGAELTFTNADPVIHNVDAKQEGQTRFNFAMPLTGMHTRRTLPRQPGLLHLGCDIHPWMEAWVRIFDHPHFTLSGADGRFELPSVPAGDHPLHLWAGPRLETIQTVHLAPGATLDLGDIDLAR